MIKNIVLLYISTHIDEYIHKLKLIAYLINNSEYEIDKSLKILHKYIFFINAFIMDIYIILLFLVSNENVIIGYFGMSHTKFIFDFFMNIMNHKSNLIYKYVPNDEYNDDIDDSDEIEKIKEKKYPKRCLKNIKIDLKF